MLVIPTWYEDKDIDRFYQYQHKKLHLMNHLVFEVNEWFDQFLKYFKTITCNIHMYNLNITQKFPIFWPTICGRQ